MKNNLPTDVIPKGDYCYDGKGSCPYWSVRDDKPIQESGYCAFLGKGDWDYNSSEEKTIVDQDGNELSPSEMPFGISLLWDQCKQCGINMYTKEEEEEVYGLWKDKLVEEDQSSQFTRKFICEKCKWEKLVNNVNNSGTDVGYNCPECGNLLTFETKYKQ